MQAQQISGHYFVGTVKTNFSYNLKQTMNIRVHNANGEFKAQAGNETYFVNGYGSCKETALQDFCLEFHLIVVELKEFNKSISGFKKAFDFVSKYLNI